MSGVRRALLLLLLVAGMSVSAAVPERRSELPDSGEPDQPGAAPYLALPVPMATGNTGTGVTVFELFSYACTDCYRFERTRSAWQSALPGDVRVERVPAVFDEHWRLLARAYYAARHCRVLDLTHDALFRAIHDGERRFGTAEEIAAFYAEQVGDSGRGTARCRSEADFHAAFDSLEVASAVHQALARSRAWQPATLPAMIVDGTWRTDGGMAGSNAAMLDVVNYLVRRVRTEGDDGNGARTSGP